MDKQIILLNGPSSSGKSTLAGNLQTLIEEKRGERYVIISIDDFMKLRTDETIYEDDVFEISHLMCEAAAEALKTAPGVIVDHVITSGRIYRQFRDMLRSYVIHTVRVNCPLNVLTAREEARKDRCRGSAEASFRYLYPKDGYDTAVDTHLMTSMECAQKIYCDLF